MTGYLDRDGYAMVEVGGKSYRAHRWSYEFFKGPLLLSDVDHECRRRDCINPAHLVNKSHGDNIRAGCTGLHNRLKSLCNYGHALTGTNVIWYPNGKGGKWRKCRTCANERSRRDYAKRKAA